MKKIVSVVIAILLVAGAASSVWASKQNAAAEVKPNAGQALQMLKAGNVRFFASKGVHSNSPIVRANLVEKSKQGDYAYATILSCFDSRVPIERIFDAGVMDLFVVRVTGKVVDIASIEYGLGHINTPLLVVFGHRQSGEQKINPGLRKDAIIPFGEENVWQGIADLFMRSPATRAQVKSGKVKVVGAIYDVTSGTVNWLPEAKVTEILAMVEKSTKKAVGVSVTEVHGVAKHHYL